MRMRVRVRVSDWPAVTDTNMVVDDEKEVWGEKG